MKTVIAEFRIHFFFKFWWPKLQKNWRGCLDVKPKQTNHRTNIFLILMRLKKFLQLNKLLNK